MPNTNNISVARKRAFEKRVKASKLPEKKQAAAVDLYMEVLALERKLALVLTEAPRRRNRRNR